MKKLTCFAVALSICLGSVRTPAMEVNKSAFGSEERFVVVENEGSEKSWFMEDLSEGLFAVADSSIFKYAGYSDAYGNMKISKDLSMANGFSEGLAFVVGYGNRLGGYIDSKGEYIIPPVFEFGMGFENGVATVTLNNKKQLINTKGKFLLNKPYESIIHSKQAEMYICRNGKTSDIYSGDFKLLKTLEHEVLSVAIANGRRIACFRDEKSAGAIDFDTGKIIVEQKCEEADYEYSCYVKHNMIAIAKFSFMEGDLDYDTQFYTNVKYLYDLNGKNIPMPEGYLAATLSENTIYISQQETVDLYRDENGVLDEKKVGSIRWSDYKKAIIKDGITEEIDYTLGALYKDKYYQSAYYDGETNFVGVVDSQAKIVVPLAYTDVYMLGENYFIGAVRDYSKPFCYFDILNTSGNKIRTVTGVKDFSGNGTEFVYRDDKNSAIVLDSELNENIIATLSDSDSFWIESIGKYAVYSNEARSFIYDRAKIDTGIPKYEYLPAGKIDVSDFYDDNEIFYKAGSFKKYMDGEYSLIPEYYDVIFWYDSVAKAYPFLSDNEAYVPIDYLTGDRVAAIDFKGTEDEPVRTIEYKNKLITFDFSKNSAVLKEFDFDKNDYVTGGINIKPLIVKDDTQFIPIKSVSEVLGLYTYVDESSLIGVGRSRIEPDAAKAKTISDGFDGVMFSLADLQRLDASLATQPFVDYFTAKALGVESAYNAVGYTNTIPGYEALIAGEKDLILVTEPSKEMTELAKQHGIEFDVVPFSKEGFVFLVNAENPTDTLSVSQLRDIYSGKTDNWSKVGGEDIPIIAYQRNESSGSQTIMENVFMNGYELANPPKDYIISAMGGLIDVVAEFKEEANGGIGYSVYYYAKQMYGTDSIRLLKVDGVEPSPETIKDGSYPIVVNYYLVKRKDDNSERTKRLVDFFLSDTGQKYVEESGLVSID